MNVNVADEQIPFDEAKSVIAGYAFGTTAPRWQRHGSKDIGDPPRLAPSPRWAYRTYDCVPASDGPLSVQDILVTQGIEARLDFNKLSAVLAVAEEVDYSLSHIPQEIAFWDFQAQEVDEEGTALREDSAAWWLWRAWWVLIGLADVGVALTHKILHHKRPRVAPLVDGKTTAYLRRSGRGSWEQILKDLQNSSRQFQALEDWFAVEAFRREGVPLFRLRIHDILTWCKALDSEWNEASAAGRKLGF